MPRTEAGKRLAENGDAYTYTRAVLADQIDAIEAEAREQGLVDATRGLSLTIVAAERERIKAAVRRELQEAAPEDPEMPPLYWDGWHAALSAVLAIIEGEKG